MRLPDGVLGMSRRGPEWAKFVDRLPGLVRGLCDDWELQRDGWMMHGYCALVVPVVTARGHRRILKVAFQDAESEHEHVALARWGGHGAVRMDRADPRRGAMLLEQLREVSLAEAWDIEACTVVGQLYGRLHVPAPGQLRPLTSFVAAWADDMAALPRNAPLPHRLVQQAVSLSRDFCSDQDSTGTMVHADLHYDNVLSADREPWLAIDPKPMSGDPHYEPAPMLYNRWPELRESPLGARAAIRRRFHTLVDTAGLDEDRARDWVVVRMMNQATWRLLDPPERSRSLPDEEFLTMCVAIAKAVQD
ncbi:MAG TPA: aminoglycoside phosphotransferase family protein [Marmoricola sp.]|nr:aminoglycoside phosphotransferase family protein [Marmoricola sp.]